MVAIVFGYDIAVRTGASAEKDRALPSSREGDPPKGEYLDTFSRRRADKRTLSERKVLFCARTCTYVCACVYTRSLPYLPCVFAECTRGAHSVALGQNVHYWIELR